MGGSTETFRSLKGAALLAVLPISLALPSKAEESDATRSADDLRTVLFGSLDGGDSTFATVGVKRTFSGSLDRSGSVGMASVVTA